MPAVRRHAHGPPASLAPDARRFPLRDRVPAFDACAERRAPGKPTPAMKRE